jgi:hypothetical protein
LREYADRPECHCGRQSRDESPPHACLLERRVIVQRPARAAMNWSTFEDTGLLDAAAERR